MSGSNDRLDSQPQKQQRPMTHEERIALITAPFPVNTVKPVMLGHAHGRQQYDEVRVSVADY